MAHIGYIRISTCGQNLLKQNSGQNLGQTPMQTPIQSSGQNSKPSSKQSLLQSLFGQLDNVQLDKIFEEKISAVATYRPVFEECMNYLDEGDTLHVQSLDRLARNLNDLQNHINTLNKKGVIVYFHTENMIFTKNASPMQEPLSQVLDAFAQFEKNLMRERQQEGIEKAKKQGRHLGRPRKLSLDDRKAIQEKLQAGKSPALVAEEYGVSASLVYKVQK